MDKITQEELNGLSPRARKQYEDSNSVLSEITTENPNVEVVKEEKSFNEDSNSVLSEITTENPNIDVVVKEEKPKKKKEEKNEEL